MWEGRIGRGDGCFVAFSREVLLSLFVSAIFFSLLANFYLEWYHLQMDTLDKLSNFIEVEDIDVIKLLYEDCRNKASIGTVQEILWF